MEKAAASWNVACIGECMVELQRGEGGGITQTFGGDTLNTAVYLARSAAHLGARVEYVTCLGDDAFSEAMLDFWRREGVGARLTNRLPGKMPGLYFTTLDQHGERVFSYWRGESAARECFDQPGSNTVLDALAGFDLVYLSGISLAVLREPGRARLVARLEELAAQGVTIAFDGNYRPRLWGATAPAALEAARPWYARLAAISGTLFLTLDELPVFASGVPGGEAGKPAALAFASGRGDSETLVKNGGSECWAYGGGLELNIPARRLDTVVDTTAAGDSFAAAYLAARRSGLDMEEAVRHAHVLAAAVVSCRGAIIPRECMPETIYFDANHVTS